MKPVYLFLESNKIRIPLYFFDKQLFGILLTNGGKWNSPGREFLFHQNTDAKKLNLALSDYYVVWVDENSPVPIKVNNYFEYASEELPLTQPSPDQSLYVKAMNTPQTHSCPDKNESLTDIEFPQPEKFTQKWQDALETELRAEKSSPRTMRSYLFFNRLMCRMLQKSPEDIRASDVTKFLALVEKDRGYCASSINLAISAIKYFYKRILHREFPDEQNRPGQDKNLPVVLAKSEVNAILSMETNPKHRLLLMLVYSSGLRVSEVVALRKEHIDIARGVINIRLAKGRKDRCTVLSEKAAALITKYCDFYHIETWLFPGQNPTRPLTIRSAQHIFDKAVRRAQITKKVSIHSFRHAFATHLLESGTDIRYIQSLLGHSSLRTTSRYTHVAKRNILSIKSPLDTM